MAKLATARPNPRRMKGLWRATAALCALAAPAAGRAQTPAELVEVTDISGLTASPDGRIVAFRTERASIDTNSYALAWHVVDLATGQVRDIGGGGAPVYTEPGIVRPEPAFWSPDGRYLLYRALVDGRIGLWRAALDGSGAVSVLVEEANIESLEGEDGGRSLLLRFGTSRDAIARAEEKERDEGILVDRSVDLGQSAYRGAYVDGRLATQRLTGYWFKRAGLLWDQPRRLRRLDLATLRLSDAGEQKAEPPGPPSSTSEPGLTARSPSGAVAIVRQEAGASTLSVRRGDSGGSIACMADPCRQGHIVALRWRERLGELILTVENARHDQSLYLWRVGAKSVRFLAGGNGLLSGGREARSPCAVTEQRAICVAAAPLEPPRLEAIDLQSGARQILYDPNKALRAARPLEGEPLEWSADGRTFTGYLIRRRGGSAPAPLVIDYYRCEGFLRGGVGDELPFASLAAAGIASLCINAPPFSGPQKAEETYRTALAGVAAIVGQLDRRGIVDRTKVGMAGLSFGSEVAMWTAMKSSLLAAVSIASTQFEPGYYWLNAVRGRDQPAILERVWGLGAPDKTPEAWRRLSPALNVERLRAPILMQLPEQEAREVVELYARLTNAATPAELYVFPDEAHIKVEPRHKLAVYRRNLDWFRFWLQAYIDPDPARYEQYRRWTSLAERRGAASQERSQSSVAVSSMTRK